MNDLAEVLRPHVEDIKRAARHGSAKAKQIISLYEMHRNCPQDPGAPALCRAAFDDWQKTRKRAHTE